MTLDVQNCLAGTEVGTLDASSRKKLGADWLVADPISAHEGKTYTHEGKNNFRTHNVVNGVRRLTPLECERLQGFPDGWTADLPDSHRYRMIGNAVAVVCAEWLGHRLMALGRDNCPYV